MENYSLLSVKGDPISIHEKRSFGLRKIAAVRQPATECQEQELQKRLKFVSDSLQPLCANRHRFDNVKRGVLRAAIKQTWAARSPRTQSLTSEISLKDLAKDLDGRISPLG